MRENSNNTMKIELRTIQNLVKNNGTGKNWFASKKTGLYSINLIIHDIKGQLGGHIYLDTHSNISNNEYISMYKTLYDWHDGSIDIAPDRLFVFCSVLKEKKKLKSSENILLKLNSNFEYHKIISRLSAIVSETASFATVVDFAIKISDIINNSIGTTEKAPLSLAAHCFYKNFGDIKPGTTHVAKLTQNIDFNFELNVSSIAQNRQDLVLNDRISLIPETPHIVFDCNNSYH